MTPAERAVLRRVLHVERVQGVILRDWEVTGAVRHCVRRQEIVDAVARELGVPPSWVVARDVRKIVQSLGGSPTKVAQRALFSGVKRRAHTEEEAIALSRFNRYDPRTERPRA